jgi:MATE family multidrug resistance protein
MKNSLLTSYYDGIIDTVHGESYNKILRYFFPEFITAFLLYSLPFWFDAYFIGLLESTSTYATLEVTNTLIHLLIKVAEAVSVGTVILSGKFNGAGEYKDVGRSLRDAFWLNTVLGGILGAILFFGAPWIYYAYGVPAKMIGLGVPFLRLQALSLFFMFVSFGFIGFLRGIKNTKVPMHIFGLGIFTFIIFDYIFIFGKFGFPQMGLQGSALAGVIRYAVMATYACAYTFLNKTNHKYAINLLSVFTDISYIKRLFILSMPIVLDKALMAMAYMWLSKMICTLGKEGGAAFGAIKNMERFSILPAVAFAQVITFLVSNDYGTGNWEGIKSNIKKVIFLASLMIFAIVIIFLCFTEPIVQLFDRKAKFTSLAAQAFPILSILGFFDLLQLILAGALRASGNVSLVVGVRLAVLVGYFIPISYVFSSIHFKHQALQFILIYGSFYVGNALMSLAYIHRFRNYQGKKYNVIRGHS